MALCGFEWPTHYKCCVALRNIQNMTLFLLVPRKRP